MKGFIHDVSQKARQNSYFRQVLETGENTQIVVMSIPAGAQIGEEVHTDNDQVLYFVEGEGKAILAGEEVNFGKDDVILVKAGTRHNFIFARKTPRQNCNLGGDECESGYILPRHNYLLAHVNLKENTEAFQTSEVYKYRPRGFKNNYGLFTAASPRRHCP